MNKKLAIISAITLLGGGILYLNKPQESNNTKELTNETLKIENSMAIYLKGDDNNYHQISAIPEGNYVLNTDETYCTEPDSEDKLTGRVAYDSGTQTLSISTLTKKNTKCYLYFDELSPSEQTLNMLNQSSLGEVENFSGTACGGSCDLDENGIYEAEDDYGTSYYYRGTVDNNWLKFGKATSGKETGDIWWRIIRINGNGSIRLIYAGTYASGTPPVAEDVRNLITPTNDVGNNYYPRSVYFNQTYNDNKYVGYMYNNTPTASANFNDAHVVTSNSTKSTILNQIELWWNQTNLSSLIGKIDVDVGFCSDTQVNNTSETWLSGDTKRGYGTQDTAYGTLGRTMLNGTWRNEQNPTLKCGLDPKTKTIEALQHLLGSKRRFSPTFGGDFFQLSSNIYWGVFIKKLQHLVGNNKMNVILIFI